MKTVTRSDLRTAVRNRGEFRDPYFSDAEINSYINISLAHLYDIIIASDPTYYITESDISVTSGTKAYSLPSNFYKSMGVAVVDSSKPDGYSVLERYNFDERYDYQYSSDKWTTRYMVRGTQIHFHPTPQWTDTVRLEYIPTPTSLDDDVTTWDSINLWTEWVIMDVLIACAAKEESDVSVWMSQREKLEQRIASVGKRDVGKPKTVVDVKRASKYDPRFWWRK